MSTFKVFSMAAGLILISVITTFSNVIHVPADQQTIQAGIDASVSADTIRVAPGTYTGDGNRDINFQGKNIILVSESGPEQTIINCQAGYMNAHWAFRFINNEDTTAVVDGFTIKGAMADESGAINLSYSSPTIRNCIITQNDDIGIYSASHAKPRIYDCVISDNSLAGILVGGQNWPFSWIEMSGCLIRNNGLQGLQLHFGGGGVKISNSTFIMNGGEGILLVGDLPKSGEKVWDSTIITNCISAFNHGYGIAELYDWFSNFNLAVRCNNSFGNDSGNWRGIGLPGDTMGNFSLDPVFCDIASDNFHIGMSSPCAPLNNSCQSLIGAFGIGCSTGCICGDTDHNGRVNILDITFLISYLYKHGSAPVPLQCADANGDGVVNMKDITTIIILLYKGGQLNCPDNGPLGSLIGHSACKDSTPSLDSKRDSLVGDCVTYSYDGSGLLTMKHINAIFNCCPVIAANVQVNNNLILVEEIDSLLNGGCDCICRFDVDYRISYLTPGIYTIRIIEPYVPQGEPILEFTVDLRTNPTGYFCINRP